MLVVGKVKVGIKSSAEGFGEKGPIQCCPFALAAAFWWSAPTIWGKLEQPCTSSSVSQAPPTRVSKMLAVAAAAAAVGVGLGQSEVFPLSEGGIYQ